MSNDLDKAKIVKRLTKHNRVVASQKLKQGDVVFTEAPTFRYSMTNNEITSSAEVQTFCKDIGIDPHLIGMPLSVVQCEPRTRKRVLAVKSHFPNVKPADSHLKILLEGSKTKRRKIDELTLPKDVSISEFVDALIVCDTKSVVLNGDELALFSGRSNVRHSCQPNCIWEPVSVRHGDDGSEGVERKTPDHTLYGLIAIRDILEGEELTISYLSERELLLPTSHRQKRLWLSRHFLCSCPCCSMSETRRVFQCLKCKSGGIPLLRENDCIPNAGIHAQLACFACGFCVSRDVFDIMLNRERQLVDAWNRLGPCSHTSWSDLSKIMDFFMTEIALILSPFHWLKSELDEIACELFRRCQKFSTARQFLENRVNYLHMLTAVGVEPHHMLTRHYRKLGDLILQEFRLNSHPYQPPLPTDVSPNLTPGSACVTSPDGAHHVIKPGTSVSKVFAMMKLNPEASPYCLLHRDSNSLSFHYDIIDQAGLFTCASLHDLFPSDDTLSVNKNGLKKLIQSLLWYKRAADLSRIAAATPQPSEEQQKRVTEHEIVYGVMKAIADKLIRRSAQAAPQEPEEASSETTSA